MNRCSPYASGGEPSRRGRPARIVFAVAAAWAWLLSAGTATPQEKEVPAARKTPGQIVEEAGRGVVLISVENKAGERLGLGSGFLIDDKGWVATNFHVVRRGAKARVMFRDGTEVAVKGLLAYDKDADLAVIELEKVPEKAQPLMLGTRQPPAPGEAVTAIGHPRGLNFSVTDGIISAVRKVPEAKDPSAPPPAKQTILLQTTAMVAGGSSGGPLLTDDGRVVGINVSMLRGMNVAFAVHVAHLLDARDRAAGATLQPLPGDPASDLFDPLVDFEPRIRDLFLEFRNAQAEHARQLEQAGFLTRAIVERNAPGPKYAGRFVQIADRAGKGTTAFQALFMAALVDKADGPAESLKVALERIFADYGREAWLKSALPELSRIPNPSIPPFFRRVIEANPHPDVRGAACFFLAQALRDSEQRDEAEVLDLLKRCEGEFKEVKIAFEAEARTVEMPLGELVKPLIFEVENLSVGRKAPEIAGKDVDGRPMKLSDYRGKVVVVDFFADWCPYCVEMYPEQRELVREMAGKPFALLGVNCDGEDTLRQLLDDKKVTWPCWADGKEGPIASAWQVDGYPQTYLIDAEGVIRRKFTGRTPWGQFKQAVSELVEALPTPKPATGGAGPGTEAK